MRLITLPPLLLLLLLLPLLLLLADAEVNDDEDVEEIGPTLLVPGCSGSDGRGAGPPTPPTGAFLPAAPLLAFMAWRPNAGGFGGIMATAAFDVTIAALSSIFGAFGASVASVTFYAEFRIIVGARLDAGTHAVGTVIRWLTVTSFP